MTAHGHERVTYDLASTPGYNRFLDDLTEWVSETVGSWGDVADLDEDTLDEYLSLHVDGDRIFQADQRDLARRAWGQALERLRAESMATRFVRLARWAYEEECCYVLPPDDSDVATREYATLRDCARRGAKIVYVTTAADDYQLVRVTMTDGSVLLRHRNNWSVEGDEPWLVWSMNAAMDDGSCVEQSCDCIYHRWGYGRPTPEMPPPHSMLPLFYGLKHTLARLKAARGDDAEQPGR
jgi:hypothetical protein